MTDDLEEQFRVIGNHEVVSNALEEINRIDVRELDDEQSRAYADLVKGAVWLRESMRSQEEGKEAGRAFKRELRESGFGVTDDD